MNSTIADKITSLVSEGSESIKSQQLSSIPFVDNEMYDKPVTIYKTYTSYVLINPSNEICLKLNYLRVKNMTITKLRTFKDSKYTMNYLVENEFIHPFLLFINGKFVKWSYISIVSNYDTYYLDIVINDINVFELYKSVQSVEIISIPFNISYWEETAAITTNTIFSFNNNGLLDISTPTVQIIKMSNIYYKNYVTSSNVSGYPLLMDSNYKIFPENILVFKNGVPYTAASIEVTSDFLTIDSGVNTNTLDFKLFYNLNSNRSNELITKAANQSLLETQIINRNNEEEYGDYLDIMETTFNITMDQLKSYNTNIEEALLKIVQYNFELLNSVYEESANLEIMSTTGLWVNTNAVSNVLTISRRNKDANNEGYIIMLVNGAIYSNYYQHTYINNKFQVPIQNIENSDVVEFLVFKNVNNKVYDKTLHFDYTYENVNEDIINDNMLIFCSETSDNTFRYPSEDTQVNFNVPYTILEDSEGKSKICITETNLFSIGTTLDYIYPISDPSIAINDNIITGTALDHQYGAIIKNTKYSCSFGQIFTLSATFSKTERLLIRALDASNNVITTGIPGAIYNSFYQAFYVDDSSFTCLINSLTISQIQVGAVFIDTVVGTRCTISDIKFVYEYHYEKPLKIAYNNRFAYSRTVIPSSYSNVYITLNDSFYYCPDYNKYVVFINGKRIDKENYRFVLPIKSTTPFYKYELYVTIPITTGDIIEVFYLPIELRDIIIADSINTNGDIIIDRTKINYNLNIGLYMIWLNGKKVAKDHIVNIDSNRIKIITDQKSINSLFITKYIPDLSDLSTLFQNNSSLWDTIVLNNFSSDSELYSLLSITPDTLTNTDVDIFENAYPIRSIMIEFVRNNYMKNELVDSANGFLYDYTDIDTSIIGDEVDSAGNIILDVANANNIDAVDIER